MSKLLAALHLLLMCIPLAVPRVQCDEGYRLQPPDDDEEPRPVAVVSRIGEKLLHWNGEPQEHPDEPSNCPVLTEANLRHCEHDYRQTGQGVYRDVHLVPEDVSLPVMVPGPRSVPVSPPVLLAPPVFVIGLIRRGAVLEPGPDDGAVEGDLLSLDDSHSDQPDDHDREDLDYPTRPKSLCELVERRSIRDLVRHLPPDSSLQLQGYEPLWVGVEEENQLEDALHALEVHQKEGDEDGRWRLALRSVSPPPIRIDYPVDVGEIVPLEELLRGEGFFPYRFRLLVLGILTFRTLRKMYGACMSSPILQIASPKAIWRVGHPYPQESHQLDKRVRGELFTALLVIKAITASGVFTEDQHISCTLI